MSEHLWRKVKVFAQFFSGILVIGVMVFGGLMIFKAKKSRENKNWVQGLQNGSLAPCSGEKPNCVSSVNSEDQTQNYVPPIEAQSSEELETLWTQASQTLQSLGFDIVVSSENYLHATETSPLLGFVDDIEFFKNLASQRIEIRSASRVGYSDLGANRKRVLHIRKKMALK